MKKQRLTIENRILIEELVKLKYKLKQNNNSNSGNTKKTNNISSKSNYEPVSTIPTVTVTAKRKSNTVNTNNNTNNNNVKANKNNVVKTGNDQIWAQKDKDTDQIIITDLVNNTEFYKYTKPPSCLMPNNSDLNYMY